MAQQMHTCGHHAVEQVVLVVEEMVGALYGPIMGLHIEVPVADLQILVEVAVVIMIVTQLQLVAVLALL